MLHTFTTEKLFVSQVCGLLSDIEQVLSDISVEMSSMNVKTKRTFLSRVSRIIDQVESIISSTNQPQDSATDLWWWDERGEHLEQSYGQEDFHISNVFFFSVVESCVSLESRSSTAGSSTSSIEGSSVRVCISM